MIINGTVELIDDLDELRHWAAVIGGRYMGADQADAFGIRNGVPGELLVRLHPTKTISGKTENCRLGRWLWLSMFSTNRASRSAV